MHTKLRHHDVKKNVFAASLFSLLVLLTACSNSSQFPGVNKGSSIQSSDAAAGNNSSSGEITTPVLTPTPEPAYKMEALAWETSSKPERALWSAYLQKIILENWNTLLSGADDIENFCPT
ncbi:MAG: hypothetical protein ACM3MG_10320, partial [Bacillota bacterium]